MADGIRQVNGNESVNLLLGPNKDEDGMDSGVKVTKDFLSQMCVRETI